MCIRDRPKRIPQTLQVVFVLAVILDCLLKIDGFSVTQRCVPFRSEEHTSELQSHSEISYAVHRMFTGIEIHYTLHSARHLT